MPLREAFGDLWEMPATVRCITTNGYVAKGGRAVMGRGVALQAATRYPWLPARLGGRIERGGNHTRLLGAVHDCWLASFPVKHHWREQADLKLIERSAGELVALLDSRFLLLGRTPTALLPRPGCGNGRLRWEDVREVLEPILDDRIVVVARPEEAD